MRRFSRVSALAAIAAVAAGALTLGVAAPAQAVATASVYDYRLTVLPSVYSTNAGYTSVESMGYMNAAAAGTDPDKVPLAPLSPAKPWIKGGLQGAAIYAGTSAVVSAGGTIGWMFPSPGNYTDALERANGNWWEMAQCEQAPNDWLGSLLNGAGDWVMSLFGVDCNAVRDGWLEKDPAYEPIMETATGVAPGYPGVASGRGYGTPANFSLTFDVVWSDHVRTNGGPVSRKEGWVMKLSRTSGLENTYSIRHKSLSESGVLGPEVIYYGGLDQLASSNSNDIHSHNPEMVSKNGEQYIVLSMANGTSGAWTETSGVTVTRVEFSGPLLNNSASPGQLPYINPTSGTYDASTDPGHMVLLTTVTTADGNRFQCRTDPFLQTDVEIPTPCNPTIPFGQWEDSRLVEMIPADTPPSYVPGSNPVREVQRTDTTPEYDAWRNGFAACVTAICHMDLIKNGMGSCFGNETACLDWANDPDRASKYTCTYGGENVALSECEAGYPNVFDRTKREQGQAYPQPAPAPGTSAPPNQQTSPGTAPGIAPGTSPLPPNQPRNCWPTGWGLLNPFEWVYLPVKCVIEWAFVPRPEYVTQQTKLMQAKWTGSSLVGLLGVFEQGKDLMLSASGCAGPHISLNIMGGQYAGNPLSACAEPMSGVATFSRLFTMVSAWVMAAASIARSVGGVVGFTKLGGD